MKKNYKSLSVISILFYLALLSVIVVMLVIATKKHVSFFGNFFGETSEQSAAYNRCLTYCLSASPKDKCKYGDKEILCAAFLSVFGSSFVFDDEIFNEGSLTALGIKKENLVSNVGSSEEYKCKIYDFLNIEKRTLGKGIGIPSLDDIRKSVERTIEKYGSAIEEISENEGIDPCVLVSTVAIESSGGVVKRTKYISCGITMITPQNLRSLGYCNAKESDKECCEKIAKNDRAAIELSVKLFKRFENNVNQYIFKNNYPIDEKGVFKLAYLFAYYNGGGSCMGPSKSCSFTSCKNLKEDLRGFDSIPIFMCAYKPGGCIETQAHVTKSLYAYKICKETW